MIIVLYSSHIKEFSYTPFMNTMVQGSKGTLELD